MSKESGALRVEDFAAGGGAEQRRERRHRSARIIDVLPCAARETWTFVGVELTDCSLSGMGFVSPDPMQPGEQFLAKLLLRGRMRMLLYTVRHCRPGPPGGFAVGAEFSGCIVSPYEEDPQEILAQLLESTAASTARPRRGDSRPPP